MAKDDDNVKPDFVPTGVSTDMILAGRHPLPEPLADKMNLSSWAESLANKAPYKEPDPDYLSRMLLVQTLTAATIDEVFAQSSIRKLQELVPNLPGQTTGPGTIIDLYVTGSDFGEGMPCYILVDFLSANTGELTRFSTGASQLQAQILALLSFGRWPIDCEIKRTDRKDRGGRYLFWLSPVDG